MYSIPTVAGADRFLSVPPQKRARLETFITQNDTRQKSEKKALVGKSSEKRHPAYFSEFGEDGVNGIILRTRHSWGRIRKHGVHIAEYGKNGANDINRRK